MDVTTILRTTNLNYDMNYKIQQNFFGKKMTYLSNLLINNLRIEPFSLEESQTSVFFFYSTDLN